MESTPVPPPHGYSCDANAPASTHSTHDAPHVSPALEAASRVACEDAPPGPGEGAVSRPLNLPAWLGGTAAEALLVDVYAQADELRRTLGGVSTLARTLRDDTRRITARALEERFAPIDALPIGVAYLTAEFVLNANTLFAALVGRPRHAVEHAVWWDFVEPHDAVQLVYAVFGADSAMDLGYRYGLGDLESLDLDAMRAESAHNAMALHAPPAPHIPVSHPYAVAHRASLDTVAATAFGLARSAPLGAPLTTPRSTPPSVPPSVFAGGHAHGILRVLAASGAPLRTLAWDAGPSYRGAAWCVVRPATEADALPLPAPRASGTGTPQGGVS